MINFTKPPGARVLELGGGANRHPLSDVNVDVRKVDGVDFEVDFNKPEWPEIGSNEFDIVYCCFCLEHISYTNTVNFLKQTFRVTKPGGRVLFVVPNTEAQMKYILGKDKGWDGDESCMLFGQQDYSDNAHKAAFSPTTITKKFMEAGFVNILITPFGQLKTDMVVEAAKPALESIAPVSPPVEETPKPVPEPPSAPPGPRKSASEVYNREYWDNYRFSGFVWDYPENIGIAQKILDKQPQSVVELGAGRGYVLKRIQDAGIPVQGIDVSHHAWMTRVCDPINIHDLVINPWPLGSKECDLCYSICLLEHIPEDTLEKFTSELSRISKRGLHAVVTNDLHPPTNDNTRCTLRDLSYWRKILPEGHEVVDIREMTAGTVPREIAEGDGRIKLNLGCAWTMYYGWNNLDTIDAESFSRIFGYKYTRHDIKNGLPYSTGVVDRIHLHHVLEHFTYEEGLRLFRECRRVIRPDGALRIAVPNTHFLANCYVYDRHELNLMGQMNAGCANAPTYAGKLWSILAEGHKAFHDEETLQYLLDEAGWEYHPASFRQTEVPAVQDILKETLEMAYGGSVCFCDATPKLKR